MNQKIFYIKDGEARMMELDPRGHFISDAAANPASVEDWFSETFVPPSPQVAAAKTKYLNTLSSALREGVTLDAFLDRLRGYAAWVRQQQGLPPLAVIARPGARPPQPAPAQDPDARQVATKFHDLSVPCFFEGCEQLRAELARQLEEAGVDCSDCDRNRIMTQFSRLAVAALRRNSPDHDLS